MKTTAILGYVSLCASLLAASVARGAETADLANARTRVVAEARSGHLAHAIDSLRALHATHPEDPLITADLIVLMRLAGQNAQIAVVTSNTDPGSIPDYALLDWARAMRDQKDFARAAAILEKRRQALGAAGEILYATVLVEAGKPEAALAALPDRSAPGLNATDLADMAYVQRRAGNPAQGLMLCEQALSINRKNPQALREEVFALSDLTAANAAQHLAGEQPALFKPDTQNRLRADVAAIHIREAIAERRRLEDLNRYRERNLPLQRTLAELVSNRAAFADDAAQQLRTRYDQIYVLRELNLMQSAIAEYESLPEHPATADAATLRRIPVYVREAAADAYLYLHHPNRAAALYEGLIAQNPKAEVSIFIGLYYACLDGEHYAKAEQVLVRLHKVTPTWIAAKGDAPNWERLDVDQLWAMDAAYRNDEATGYARMSELVAHAPGNGGLLNAEATLARWRGWPALALQTTLLAAAYSPNGKDTRINLAISHSDLGLYPLWGSEITALDRDFLTDTSVQKSLAQWNDRRHASISSEYTAGQSSGGATTGNPITGNQDQEWQTRVNSPWNDQGWRAFIDQDYIWSSFPPNLASGPISYNRLGLGTEWRGERQHFWAIVADDQLTGQNTGVSAGWSQWLNDHWQYAISGSTYSLDTPLLAKNAGFSGESVNGKLNWRQDESREAYAALNLLAISDGNERTDFATGITQRLFASPYHITSGGIDLFAEHNSQPGGAYFNPAASENASLRLEHEWTTWRSYEQSLTQYFKMSAGYGWQTDYGAAPTFDLLYEHKWKFSRTWDLHYGLGWGSNVYDGGREYRLYGLIGFGGVF